jgi:transposase
MLPFPEPTDRPEVRWFSSQGCVVRQGQERLVYIGGALVSTFSTSQSGLRNVLLVQLGSDPKAHLGKLAEAFGVTAETLRQLQRLYEKAGLEAVWKRHRGGSESKVTPQLRAKLEGMFDEGFSAHDAHGQLRGNQKVGLRTVQSERANWRAKKSSETPREQAGETGQETLCLAAAANDVEMSETPARPAAEERTAAEQDATIGAAPVRGAAMVQHLGTWLMMAMVHRLGLYARAGAFAEDRVNVGALRIALQTSHGVRNQNWGWKRSGRRRVSPGSVSIQAFTFASNRTRAVCSRLLAAGIRVTTMASSVMRTRPGAAKRFASTFFASAGLAR